MLDLRAFSAAIAQIEDEKGISKEKIIEAIEMAIAAAYKKDYGERGQDIRAKVDLKTGKLELSQVKIVVDESTIKSEEEIEAERGAAERGESKEVEDEDAPKRMRFNSEKHIMMDEAKKIKKTAKLDDELVFPLEEKEEFGRVAAQTAKQVIIQRIREAERDSIREEFGEKEGLIIGGIVQRIEGSYVFFDIGKTVGILPPKEQVEGERYRMGDRMRLYVLGLEQTAKGPQVYVSRTHPQFIAKLFELEVPEIPAGTVEIKDIAREAGSRTKIAVVSTEDGVDPIGSLVGQRGTRVTAVIQELGGEKIDIIEWSEDEREFIAHALSPAQVLDVEIEDNGNSAIVTVAEDQLSLAIGKGGQNVRLAARLTGKKLGIKSQETGEVQSVEEEVVAEEKDKEEKKTTKKKAAKKEKTEESKEEKKKKVSKKDK